MSQAIIEWLANGETGMSSRNIAFYLGFGIIPKREAYFAPSDPSDLCRCLKLLEVAPELRKDLPKMAGLSKHWQRIVDRWEDVEKCFLEEVGHDWSKGKTAPKTFALMKEIYCGEF